MAEEKYNMENHFEKYFSLSGFLRDILNEIIKLQNEDEKAAEGPTLSPKMLLKLLDIITYFFSGNLDLRRGSRLGVMRSPRLRACHADQMQARMRAEQA